MANDENIVFKLDLDAKEFMSNLSQINERLGSLEKSAKTVELASMFDLAGVAVEGFRTAIQLAGKAMDLVFEGENIRAINYQFELLAKNAGIAGDKFKEALDKAAGGLIDDTELLEIANKTMSSMGANAEGTLERIVGVARKASAIFGGDLKDNIETFERALATGNIRALRQFQIVIDQEKAVRNYAKALGLTVDALSEQERRQALANAALDQAEKKFKDARTDLRSTQSAWKQLKNAVNDVSDTILEFISKVFGPIFTNAFKAATLELKAFSANLKAALSDDPIVKSKALADQIEILEGRMRKMREGPKEIFNQAEYNALQATLEATKVKFDSLADARQKAGGAKAAETGEGKAPEEKADQERRMAAATKFEQDLLELRKARIQAQIEVEQSPFEQERNLYERRMVLEQEKNLRLADIDNQFALGQIATAEQTQALKLQIEQKFVSDIVALKQQEEATRLKVYQNEVRAADSASKGVAAAFRQGSAQARADINSFGAQGQRVYQNFTRTATDSLIELGKGQKKASEIAKGFVFGMLADEAEARGRLMLLASIFPPNPAGLGAGAALLVLSGFLRSQAGGSGGGGAVGGGNIAGGGMGGPDIAGMGPVSGTASPNAQQFEQTKKAVTIQVMGSYFETEQTRQRLLEMIRSETDATDFKYVQIGGR